MDLKCYCTEYMYNNYKKGGILYTCAPERRRKLFEEEGRKEHKDLNIRLSLNRDEHSIKELDEFDNGWYEIRRK